MTLRLEVEIDKSKPYELDQLCDLIRERWLVADIQTPDDTVNKTHKFILIRD